MTAGPSREANLALISSTNEQPDVQLNLVGDVVACDGIGELVLLPHLWNFDLLAMGNVIVLRTTGNDFEDGRDGNGTYAMTATLTLAHGLATVQVVTQTSRQMPRVRAEEGQS